MALLLLLLLPLLYFLMKSTGGDQMNHAIDGETQIVVPDTPAVNCNATIGWDAAKQAFCCANFHVGCPETTPKPTTTPKPFTTSLPFDCNADWTTCYTCLQHRWSVAKRGWCCEHARRGCPTQAPVPQPQPVTSAPYDCNADYTTCHHCLINRWSISKRTWCCTNAHKGCSTLPGGR